MTCDMWHEMCPLLKYIDICMIFDIYYIYIFHDLWVLQKKRIYIYTICICIRVYMYRCMHMNTSVWPSKILHQGNQTAWIDLFGMASFQVGNRVSTIES